MHYIVLDRLSRQSSYLHSIDGRFKLIALLGILIAIATCTPFSAPMAVGFLALLCLGLVASKLPAGWIARRAATVLPFTVSFAMIAWWTDGPERGITLLTKGYMSAVAVLLVVASTPMPNLIHSAARLGVPALVVEVIGFLYRYLFLIADEGRRMWAAAQLRGYGSSRARTPEKIKAAAGSLAVLFARTMQKAGKIQLSMVARGFDGKMPASGARAARFGDFAFLGVSLGLVAGLRVWLCQA